MHRTQRRTTLTLPRSLSPRTHDLVVCRGFGDILESGFSATDFGSDVVGVDGPYKRLRIIIPELDPCVDRGHEFFGGSETGIGEDFADQDGKPCFDQLQPESRGWREMQMPPFPFGVGEPDFDGVGFVDGEITQDNLDLQVSLDISTLRSIDLKNARISRPVCRTRVA